MKGWLDNFGKADNANDSNVSLPEGFVGLGYNTKGRNYSPAWGGQFEEGGEIAQRGKQIDKILNANKNLDWVQGLYDPNYGSVQIPGQEGRSTHFMESADRRVYPTVRNIDGQLKYLGDDAYNYADSTNSYIEFPTDRKAQKFAKNYKRGTGVLDFQGGGKLIPVSPMQQITGETPTISPTVPYLQTKDPAEFYKSWIQSPEYERRLKSTGYSDVPNRWHTDKLSEIEKVKKERLGLLENIQPLEYNRSKRSEAIIYDDNGPTININPSDYEGSARQSIEAHEIAHVATPPSTMSGEESGIFMGSMLPLKKPIVSGVQGSKEREASIEAVGDFEHSGKPWEAKADLDALRFMMYDKGIYDITKGKKFTESDFEKVKQSFGKERVFKRFTDKRGKENFVKLMNTIAKADGDEELPMAMGGMSIPGSVGFTYARTAGSAPSKGKYAKKTMASAQNGIMSPMLLARNVLNYFYPNEETAPAVEAAPSDYKKGLTNELLQRQAYKESTFNPAAVSPAGYKGLTQIGEGVLKDYSNKKGGKKLDPFNPKDAVELQKFAMDDLYNASFINKPEQSDSVRIAKTLAAYNWGRGNLSNYLNEQKSKGVDIYGSYDWLNNLPKETSDYVNKILLQEDPSFNKNYKKASTNPKYEEVTSLYDQKKFGGEIPSAQNGQEMKFYQNGLDWKPKSMQDGGEEIYQGLELPEFVVEGKDERMKEAMSQGIRKFYGHVGELMGAPQKEAMQLITGKEQTPSEAWGFQNSGDWLDSYSSFGKNLGNLAMDAVLDPVNAVPGVGLIDDLTRGAVRAAAQDAVSKTLKNGISPWGYELENVLRIPQNLIRTSEGKSKKFSSAVEELIKTERANTILQSLKNREDAWSTYLGQDRDFNTMRLVGSDDVTGLSKYEYTNPVTFQKAPKRLKSDATQLDKRVYNTINKNSDGKMYSSSMTTPNYGLSGELDLNVPGSSTVGNDQVFGTMGGFKKYVSPDGKHVMYRDVWDLQPFSRLTSKQLPNDMLGNAIRNFEVSSIVPGAKPFVAEGKLGDIKTKFLPAQPYKDIKTRFDEQLGYLSNYYEPEAYVRDIDNPTPEEIFEYKQAIKDEAKRTLLERIKNERTFLNPSNNYDSRKYVDTNPYTRFGDRTPDLSGFDFTPSKPEKILRNIQDFANQPVSKFEVGGVIKDNQGYWNPDNWGKPVEIDSNDITMEPSPYTGVEVPYNVLGVSDTGDTKLMKPGKNYKFKGKKVTEYPVAKLGINQLDTQPMKKLNQLLNFTNNPDKDNWLDKYN